VSRYKKIKKKPAAKQPDEFLTFWHHAYIWLENNREKLLLPTLAVLVVFVLGFGYLYYTQQMKEVAQRELYFALKSFPRPGNVNSASADELEQTFSNISQKFSSTPARYTADLYHAHLLADQGKTDEALKIYNELFKSGKGGATVTEMAGLSIAWILQDQGKFDESNEIIKKMEERGRQFFPEEARLLTARNYELSEDRKNALAEYRRFVEEYPASQNVEEVNDKITELMSKSM